MTPAEYGIVARVPRLFASGFRLVVFEVFESSFQSTQTPQLLGTSRAIKRTIKRIFMNIPEDR